MGAGVGAGGLSGDGGMATSSVFSSSLSDDPNPSHSPMLLGVIGVIGVIGVTGAGGRYSKAVALDPDWPSVSAPGLFFLVCFVLTCTRADADADAPLAIDPPFAIPPCGFAAPPARFLFSSVALEMRWVGWVAKEKRRWTEGRWTEGRWRGRRGGRERQEGGRDTMEKTR